MSIKIGIVDYGTGNVKSIKRALDRCGVESILTSSEMDIEKCDGIILPGVGAFKHAKEELNKLGLVEIIKKYVKTRPILGICLGMQLLFEKSYENGEIEGLALIPGDVRPLKEKIKNGKVPNIGWYKLSNISEDSLVSSNLNAEYYFVHSYYVSPTDEKCIVGKVEYNGFSYSVAIEHNNIFGCQFHPEKSREVGLDIIRNFIEACVKEKNV